MGQTTPKGKNSMTTEEMYAQMSQQQRNQMAQEFVKELGGHPDIDLNNVSAQQLVALHDEAKQKDPGILDRIRKHPLLTGVLGGIAVFELDRHFGPGHH
jgi:hypothetical protein